MLTHRVLALGAALALAGCGGGIVTPAGSSGGQSRTPSDLTATSANGALAMPGNGALAMPGNGALAMPGGGSISWALAALVNTLPLCAVATIMPGSAQCTALLNTTVAVVDDPTESALAVAGLHPADLQSAYNIPYGGSGRTVAVIDAGDDPTAASDLAVYRSTFGLPPCTSSTGCFRKVNQAGGNGNLPPVLSGWPQETGIDIEMVSAVCPACNILLVEANSAQLSDLAASVDTAATRGANAVSNSYYAPEYSGELNDEQHFNHPSAAITVSSGDLGYGTTFPASSRYVTAVSGTTLVRGSGTWSETVWAGTGSGCSAYVPKPAWQHDGGCATRTVADVAVIGNPETGVSAYNTTTAQGQSGWGVYGGTSVGAPIVAAMYALAGASRVDGASTAYAAGAPFTPVLTGANGLCSPSYLCTAGPGYSGPGGVGFPSGVGGF